MMIWGRIIGAILGSYFGVVGTIIGFSLGYFFDNGLKRSILGPEKIAQINKVFLKTTFLVMGHITKADGIVSESEIKAATKIMHDLGLSSEQRKEAIHLFNYGKSGDFNLEKTLNEFLATCGFHVSLLRFFIEFQLQAAMADGELRKPQKDVLTFICKKFNFTLNDFEAFYNFDSFSSAFNSQSSQKENSSWQDAESSSRYNRHNQFQESKLDVAYKVLGVQPSVTDKEVKNAYRKLMSMHHPDKLAAKGLPNEMMQFAKEKTQEITSAYDLICESRGLR